MEIPQHNTQLSQIPYIHNIIFKSYGKIFQKILNFDKLIAKNTKLHGKKEETDNQNLCLGVYIEHIFKPLLTQIHIKLEFCRSESTQKTRIKMRVIAMQGIIAVAICLQLVKHIL